MIFSVFSNVLTNGVRYARSYIEICAICEPGKVILVITDDGPGISQEAARHPFDRFYKGEKDQSGLGMALAKEYMILHQGSISKP